MKRILLITSTNLSSNPRCLKELRLFVNKGYKVALVAFHLHNWTDEKEIAIKQEFAEVDFYYLETTKLNFFPWLIASSLERIARIVANKIPSNLLLQALSVSKRSWLILQWCKKWNSETDLIIAHNPPAFYGAYWLSKKRNNSFALDIEDYHPEENNTVAEKKSVTILMRSLIPKTIYTSFASPLIKVYSEKLLDKNNAAKLIVINNTFPQQDFSLPPSEITKTHKLKLVWFSQFIDYGRGLEKILPALDDFAEKIELTLIGNLRDTFFNEQIASRKYIVCVSSMSQINLHQTLSSFDVGLALEDKHENINRNLCLTNKIWSYYQAGLYIVASDTDAQTEFLNNKNEHGIVTPLDKEDFSKAVKNILVNKEIIIANKTVRYKNASQYNWENESSQLLESIV